MWPVECGADKKRAETVNELLWFGLASWAPSLPKKWMLSVDAGLRTEAHRADRNLKTSSTKSGRNQQNHSKPTGTQPEKKMIIAAFE